MSSSFCRRPRPASSRIAWGSVLMPTPSSRIVSACSNNSQPMPRARSISAVVRPPIPPPTIIAFIVSTPLTPSNTTARKVAFGSLGRKRLCRLGLQLGTRLGLSLNFQVVEILPVTHAVAENLLLAGQGGGGKEDISGAVQAPRVKRKRGRGERGPPGRPRAGAPPSQYRI